ncbi:unnamed protein product, partial [Mesorhabditis spiculigera]
MNQGEEEKAADVSSAVSETLSQQLFLSDSSEIDEDVLLEEVFGAASGSASLGPSRRDQGTSPIKDLEKTTINCSDAGCANQRSVMLEQIRQLLRVARHETNKWKDENETLRNRLNTQPLSKCPNCALAFRSSTEDRIVPSYMKCHKSSMTVELTFDSLTQLHEWVYLHGLDEDRHGIPTLLRPEQSMTMLSLRDVKSLVPELAVELTKEMFRRQKKPIPPKLMSLMDLHLESGPVVYIDEAAKEQRPACTKLTGTGRPAKWERPEETTARPSTSDIRPDGTKQHNDPGPRRTSPRKKPPPPPEKSTSRPAEPGSRQKIDKSEPTKSHLPCAQRLKPDITATDQGQQRRRLHRERSRPQKKSLLFRLAVSSLRRHHRSQGQEARPPSYPTRQQQPSSGAPSRSDRQPTATRPPLRSSPRKRAAIPEPLPRAAFEASMRGKMETLFSPLPVIAGTSADQPEKAVNQRCQDITRMLAEMTRHEGNMLSPIAPVRTASSRSSSSTGRQPEDQASTEETKQEARDSNGPSRADEKRKECMASATAAVAASTSTTTITMRYFDEEIQLDYAVDSEVDEDHEAEEPLSPASSPDTLRKQLEPAAAQASLEDGEVPEDDTENVPARTLKPEPSPATSNVPEPERPMESRRPARRSPPRRTFDHRPPRDRRGDDGGRERFDPRRRRLD